jgi:ribosomal protein S6--L-glutamate ligase
MAVIGSIQLESARRPASTRAPRIGILAERRYLSQRAPAALAAALADAGVRPEVVAADDARFGLGACDLVIARGRSQALLSALSALEARGVAVMNRPAAIAAVADKARQAGVLARGGLPSPRTLVVTPAGLAEAAARVGFPVVVKPVFGDNGRGVLVLHTRDEAQAAARAWSEPRALVQPLVPSAGVDLKLYAVGREIWAVEKPSPLAAAADAPARAVALPPGARALALRCGALFGLDLFGVDCLATPSGLTVIEVNDFPNYSSIPDADAAMARLALARAARRLP